MLINRWNDIAHPPLNIFLCLSFFLLDRTKKAERDRGMGRERRGMSGLGKVREKKMDHAIANNKAPARYNNN